MSENDKAADKPVDIESGPDQFLGVLLDLTSKLQMTLDRMEEVVAMQRKELDDFHTRLRSIEEKLEIEPKE